MAIEVGVIEPYFGGSHREWAQGLASHSRHSVRLLTLPGRWWKWRMRGGAVTLAEQAARLACEGYHPDLLLVSGMIDLPALRSFLHPVWGRVPCVLYFHESQLSYPEAPRAEPDLSYAFTNWLSALAADRVVFNSEYHREVFFDRLPALLRGFPDETHEHRIPEVRERSAVIPVGVDLSWIGPRASGAGPPVVIWNHRWEHDKRPDLFAAAIDELAAAEVEFRLALCGERPPSDPPALQWLRRRHAARILHDGAAGRDEYRAILLTADVVVSTAEQEFQGTAVVEAVAAGAFPVLPDRLNYPALLPETWHPVCLYATDPVPALTRALGDETLRIAARRDLGAAMSPYSWPVVISRYDGLFAEMG